MQLTYTHTLSTITKSHQFLTLINNTILRLRPKKAGDRYNSHSHLKPRSLSLNLRSVYLFRHSTAQHLIVFCDLGHRKNGRGRERRRIVVFGMIERGSGRTFAFVVCNVKAKTLLPFILKYIRRGKCKLKFAKPLGPNVPEKTCF